MYEVAVLKVVDPSCFWCQILKGNDLLIYDNKEYEHLFEELNTLYEKYYRDVEDLKPSSLPIGEVCMVFCKDWKSWCRATLESSACSAENELIECFLPDYAVYVPVEKKNVRLAVEACQRLPFRTKKFKLHQVQPVSLDIDFIEDTAEIGPSKKWDIAAITYFQALVNESTTTYAELCCAEKSSFNVYLYIATKDTKVCVNDELVAKKFACFSSVPTTEACLKDIVSSAAQDFRHPIKNNENNKETSNPAMLLWPVLPKAKVPQTELADFPLKGDANIEIRSCDDTFSESTQECDVIHDFTKLLQILNPEPVMLTEYSEQSPKFKETRCSLFVRKKVHPCSTLESAPLATDLRKELKRCGYPGPNTTESFSWPSIAKGFDTIVISPDGMNPMNYIPPILTYLHFALAAYKVLPCRNAPLAVFICHEVKKAQTVFELLVQYSKYVRPLKPMLLLAGLNKEDLENLTVRKGCEVVVTTPYSLLRFLDFNGLLFQRLCHLIFDEVELLFTKAAKQMQTILESYKRTVGVETRGSAPQQLVAVGSIWNREMDNILHYTTDPQIIITKMQQAAVYGNVQQVIQLCLDCEKTSVLLRNLDFTPYSAQKILIFTKSDEEAELVYTTIKNSSIFCLLLSRKFVDSINYVLEQWKKKFSRGTHVVMVATDENVPILEITDATCVIHFSFPESQNLFGLRLFSLRNYIETKIEKINSLEDENAQARSVLIMTEKHMHHAVLVLQYLKNTTAKIPPELNAVTLGILQAKEHKTFDREICQYLKAFGFCCNKLYACSLRHHIIPRDLGGNATSCPVTDQYISVIPLNIMSATLFFGRILTNENSYTHLLEKLNEYYRLPSNKVSAQNVELSRLYALQEESIYYRVQVLKLLPKKDDGILHVCVKYVDDGKTDEVLGHQLLLLPHVLETIPPQAVEFIVCRVKPIDDETEWDPKVTRIIGKNIKGKTHTAKVVFRLGNTYWLDPMVQVSRLSGLSTSINELNVRNEILSTGMGTDNPQHVDLLKKLLHNAEGLSCTQLDSLFRNSEEPIPETCTSSNISVSAPPVVSINCDGNEIAVPKHKLTQEKVFTGKSLHPEMKWFEKGNSITVTIKLREVTDHVCSFFSDRVVFSCHSRGKYYFSDLELCNEIIKDECKCTLSSGEPVISLVKANQGTWPSLLKQKHPNISFDFAHWEDTEDVLRLPAVQKDTKCAFTVISEEVESSEISDSDSD